MNSFIKYKILFINDRLNKINKLLKSKLLINNYNSKNLSLISERNNLFKIKNCYDNWKKKLKELEYANSLLCNKELKILAKDEIKKLNVLINSYYNKLNYYLYSLNKDKKDSLNVYLEIYAGTGGNEASLFVYDLFKMYVKYSELMKWKIELISSHTTDYKGYKHLVFKIIGKNVYNKLKFESGGHRVQRVPLTESQGRVHTSTCIVAVIPEVPLVDSPVINNNDIKIDTFRSSGSGGQHVNTTDSAVRITHIPTGLVVECQQERSQHKNKSKALEVLKSRIYSLKLSKSHDKKCKEKKKLLGSGFRNDRNRTYNFIQNRVTDHRINFTVYSLFDILSGKLNLLIDPLSKYYNEL